MHCDRRRPFAATGAEFICRRPGFGYDGGVATAPILGLDLGNSRGCVAAVDAGGVLRLLADPWGRSVIPSVISFHPSGNVLVGIEAEARLTEDPQNTLLRAEATREGARDTRAGRLSPTVTTQVLLDHLRLMADAALQADCTAAVLTVPANTDEAARRALVDDALHAKLQVERILDCPVAVAYGYGLENAPQQLVAICDFGGSKFECSIVSIDNKQPSVVASSWDPTLGGDQIRNSIADWLAEAHLSQHGLDLRDDLDTLWRLRDAAEQAKRQITAQADYGVNIAISEVGESHEGTAVDLRMLLTADVLAERSADIVDRCVGVCRNAMRRAGVQVGQIAQLILVGGVCRMPLVQRRLAEIFERAPRMDVDPVAAAALGAALFAAKTDVLDHRITSPYGAVSAPPDSEMTPPVLRRTTRVGRIITKKMFTAAIPAVTEEDLAQTAPVAEPTSPTLIEATAVQLGLSTVAGFCGEIIPASQPLPASNTRLFSTARDNQQQVRIQVCQGNSRRFAENMPLGVLVLDQLPPRPRGDVRIRVTFSIDADGVLEAHARDEQSGREQSIKVQVQLG